MNDGDGEDMNDSACSKCGGPIKGFYAGCCEDCWVEDLGSVKVDAAVAGKYRRDHHSEGGRVALGMGLHLPRASASDLRK
jgi:hypothetical protein